MSVETLFALCACALVGIGLYGLIVQPHPLRKLVAFNIMGSGVFVLFGALAKRGAAAGMAADPVPQALLITAIVVAFAATAVTVALGAAADRIHRYRVAGRRAAVRRLIGSTGGGTLDEHLRRHAAGVSGAVALRRHAARSGAGRGARCSAWPSCS
jgi:multicomponent Na+:H+ antiporter subunit C